MKFLKNNISGGFTLLELMVVIAILGILTSIALPNYVSFRERAKAACCLTNRYQIENDERCYFMDNDERRKTIESPYSCPSGGEYIWLKAADSDPNDPDYLKVVCSIHGPVHGPAPSPEEKILFSDDFDNMESLTPLRGTWEIQNGTLANKRHGENRLAFGDERWKDYEVKVNTTLSKGNGYGIYYRADKNEKISGYCFQYDPGYGKGSFLVRKVVNGREKSPIKESRTWMPDDYKVYDQPHEITVNVKGNHHIIKIDGEVVSEFYDDTFESGSAGFRTWNGTDVNFEDVTVTEIE